MRTLDSSLDLVQISVGTTNWLSRLVNRSLIYPRILHTSRVMNLSMANVWQQGLKALAGDNLTLEKYVALP